MLQNLALEQGTGLGVSSYAMTIGFPDLFGRGNLLGFVLGRPPAVIVDGLDLVADDRTAHLEVFYRYTVSDQVAITPGAMFIRTPTTSGGSEDYWIGALRMTFREALENRLATQPYPCGDWGLCAPTCQVAGFSRGSFAFEGPGFAVSIESDSGGPALLGGPVA